MAIGWIVFGCFFAGALLGLFLRRVLPEHHLSTESKDTIKLGTGLIATMGALALGLLISSAKGSYDTQKADLTQMSAKIILLDRVLAHYGPEATEARELLRRSVALVLKQMWPEDSSQSAQLDPKAAGAEAVYDKILDLAPKNEAQRALQARALNYAFEIGQLRWLLFQQSGSAISTTFLVVLVLWLTVTFVSFGLFAPLNLTVITTLLLCALSVAGAIFLILELDRPFGGLIQITSDPLRSALEQLGK